MKKIYLALVAVALTLSSGCSVKSGDDIAKDIERQTQEKIDQLKKENADTLAALKESSIAGGQPARINLNGQGMKNGELLNTERYTIASLGGQRCESENSQAVVADRTAQLSKAEDDKKTFKDLGDTFVNIGCGKNLDKKLTAGLKDATISEMKKLVTNKTAWIMTASKIFVCGNIDLSKMNYINFQADEVYLSNAVLTTNNKGTINLNLATNKLTLDGANSFSSILKDETMPSLVSPTTEVSLTVTEATLGEGVLSITAKGANCIKAEKE